MTKESPGGDCRTFRPGDQCGATAITVRDARRNATSAEIVAKNGEVTKQEVIIRLGEMEAKALSAAGEPKAERLTVTLPQAVRFYLDDADADLPGWKFPSFLSTDEPGDPAFEVPLEAELWRQLGSEADRQGVGVEHLLRHAVFYFGAARDAGRLTGRILQVLEAGENPQSSS